MSHSDPLDGKIREALAVVVSHAPVAPEFDDIEASPAPKRRPLLHPVAWAAAAVVAVLVAGAALAGTRDATVDTGMTARTDTPATDEGEHPDESISQPEGIGSDIAGSAGVTEVLDTTGKVRGVVRNRDIRAEGPELTIAGFRAARVFDDDGVVVGYLLFNNVGFVDLATAAQPDLVQALDRCFEEYALTLEADGRCRELLIDQGVNLDPRGR